MDRSVVDATPVGSVWRHRKGGTYVVLGHCVIEATCEVGVLYAHSGSFGVWPWMRPAGEFLDGRFEREPADA